MSGKKNPNAMCHHELHSTWRQMKDRCLNPKAHNYYLYGGRGIEVCQRWKDSFWDFAEDVGKRPEGHQLDRVDNDGKYEKSNIKWSTRSEQQRNTSRTRWIESADGRRLPLVAWMEIAEQNGISQGVFKQRFYKGMPLEQALTEPSTRSLKKAA